MRTLAAVALLAFALSATFAAEGDWPRWRGDKFDNISTEKGLLQNWPEEGPKLAWTGKNIGSGMSSVVVAGDLVYTMGGRGGKVWIFALNKADGKEAFAAEVGRGGDPNCTPTVDVAGGLVFGLTKDGEFACADAKTGEVKWRKSFPKDFGGKMHSGWGYSESPLVDGDNVIVTPGAKDAQIVALNKKTGETVWKSALPDKLGNKGGDGAAYSSIVPATIAGTKQYVQLVGKGCIGVDAKTGKFLWGYNKVANNTANVPTPIISGDFVFTTSGYGDGGSALLKISKRGAAFEVTEVWYKRDSELQNHHGGLIMQGNYIYGGHGHNKGIPFCLEWKTGKIVWMEKTGEIEGRQSAAVTLADGQIYFRYQDGTVTLVEATPKGFKENGSFKIKRKGESWPHPVVAGGKLYLRNQDELLCYDVKKPGGTN